MSKKTKKTNVNIGIKCFICGQQYRQKVIDMHMHSYFHHEAIEKIKGSEQPHKCWACDVSVMGLEQYKKHIATHSHTHNLFKLRNKRHKRKRLEYNIDMTDNEFKTLFDLRQQDGSEQKDLDKCSICLHRFPEQEWDKHMHSSIHHQAVEQLKGSEHEHKCWACEMTVTGISAFKKHISTQYHKMKLSDLTKNRKLGKNTVDYSVEFSELKDLCAQRDQEKSEQKDLEKCSICLQRFSEQEWDKHMHSSIHHQAVEQLKGSEHKHKCWACEMTVTGIAAFKKHISTQYHKMKLSDLTKNRKLGKNTVDYSVEFSELKDLCAQRDQEKFMKKKEKFEKWKEARRQKTMRFIQTRSTAEHGQCTTPFMLNEEFETDQLPPSCHFMSFWENQNDHPASIQHNQNLPSQRQASILDMDRSNGPLVKRPCLERPSENIPQEMSAHATLPNPDGKGTDVCVNDVTPETEDDAAAEQTCAPGLVQSRMEANIPNLTAERGVCSTRKAATGNEAVVLNPPLHSRSKKSMLKVNRAASQSEQGMTRECMSGQEPYAGSLPPVSVLADMFKRQASENELEIFENVRPHTAHVQENQPNECETEQGETSLEHHSSFEAITCNVQKTKKRKQDDSHDLNPETNNKISRKRKVNKLISLSLKEEELSSSLENVGEQLFQAYSSLQSAYTEVQRLLAVKQEVTSEMASLRAKRIKILQDMKNPGDQQEVLNES